MVSGDPVAPVGLNFELVKVSSHGLTRWCDKVPKGPGGRAILSAHGEACQGPSIQVGEPARAPVLCVRWYFAVVAEVGGGCRNGVDAPTMDHLHSSRTDQAHTQAITRPSRSQPPGPAAGRAAQGGGSQPRGTGYSAEK